MKKIKVTTPEMMKSGFELVEEAITKFEENFKKEDKGLDFYHIVIMGEYGRFICDKVESLYTDAGWGKVICRTSSENGERPGLTGLQLFRKK